MEIRRKPGAVASRRGRVALAALLAASLASPGCSTRKIAYGFADTFIVRYLDDAFDLTSDQKALLKPRIREHLAWHRREELPRYVARLDEMRARLGDGMTRDDAKWARGAIDELWDRLGDRLAPDAGRFLSTVQPDQVARLERAFAKANRERFEKYQLDKERFVRDRAKQAEKQAAQWIGPINEPQRRAIVWFLQHNHADIMARRRAVIRQQSEFAARLRKGGGAQAWATEMAARMKDPESFMTPEERDVSRRVDEHLIDLVVAIDQASTPAQRARLDGELAAIRKDLYELSADL